MHHGFKMSKRFFLGLTGGLLLSGSAWAVNPGGTIVKNSYYSDASMTVRVGERDYNCQGQVTWWGQQTMYQSFTAKECADTGGSTGGGGGGDLPGPPNCTVIYTPYPEAICGG